MTPHKRYAVGVLGALTVLALAFVVTWSLSSQALLDHLKLRLSADSHLSLTRVFKTSILLWPMPHVKLSGLELSSLNKRVTIQVLHAKGDIRLLSLLGGRLELSELTLSNFHLITRSDDKHETPINTLRAHFLDKSTHGETLKQWPPYRIVIRDGRWSHDEEREVSLGESNITPTPLSQLQLVIGRSTFSSHPNIAGSFQWHGVGVDITGRLPDLILDHAAVQRIELNLISPAGSLMVEGRGSLDQSKPWQGDFSLSSEKPQELGKWFTLPVASLTKVERLALKSPFTYSQGRLTLSEVLFDLNSDSFEGALTVHPITERQEPRFLIAGTLAASSINLLVLSQMRTQESIAHIINWLDVSSHAPFDADLRLSIGRVNVAGGNIGEVATSLRLMKGRFEANLNQRWADQAGSFKARVTALQMLDHTDIKTNITFDRIDAATLSRQLPDLRASIINQYAFWPIAGQISGSFSHEMKGQSIDAITQASIYHFDLHGSQIAVNGIDFKKLDTQLQKIIPSNNHLIYLNGFSGRDLSTRFEDIVLQGSVNEGVISFLEPSNVQLDQSRFHFKGSIALETLNTDIRIALIKNISDQKSLQASLQRDRSNTSFPMTDIPASSLDIDQDQKTNSLHQSPLNVHMTGKWPRLEARMFDHSPY